MFRAKSYLEVKVGERVYQIMCNDDSPLSELIDVLDMVKKQVQGVLEEIEKKKSEEAKLQE